MAARGHNALARSVALWLGLAGLGVLLLFVAVAAAGFIGRPNIAVLIGFLGASAILLGVLRVFTALARRQLALDRFRTTVIALTGEERLSAAPPAPADADPEIDGLYAALAAFVEHRIDQAAETDRRLAQVLSALGDAILVIGEGGRVSLVNSEAADLLGRERVAVGTSVFAALRTGPLNRAIDDARAADKPVAADLVTNEGHSLAATLVALPDGAVVVSIPHEITEAEPDFDHNLFLLDAVPEPPPVTHRTPLADLPVFVLDTETTGLDVATDAVIAVGGVRMHGARIFPTANIDRLVDPGRPVPKASTAVHGIDDKALRGAPRFPKIWPELRQLMAGCVLVGHNIGFDIAHLQRTMREEGLRWSAPERLDTALLAAALNQTEDGLTLDALAARYGIEVRGRHTALGDALVTAELYARLIPQLRDAGVYTLGDALALQAGQTGLIERQRQAGWWEE